MAHYYFMRRLHLWNVTQNSVATSQSMSAVFPSACFICCKYTESDGLGAGSRPPTCGFCARWGGHAEKGIDQRWDPVFSFSEAGCEAASKVCRHLRRLESPHDLWGGAETRAIDRKEDTVTSTLEVVIFQYLIPECGRRRADRSRCHSISGTRLFIKRLIHYTYWCVASLWKYFNYKLYIILVHKKKEKKLSICIHCAQKWLTA